MKQFYFLLLSFTIVLNSQGQTMTFDTGASESGFNFSGWNSGGGIIFLSDLSNPASITKDSGNWNLTSFDTAPFSNGNNMRITSNLGDSYDYNTSTAATHNLNWTNITSVTIQRISGSGASADYDNFVYTISTLSIDSFEKNMNIKLFPNPSNDYISISNLNQEENYEIYNIIGQKVRRGIVLENEKIDIQSLTNGIYILKLQNKNSIKFIKD